MTYKSARLVGKAVYANTLPDDLLTSEMSIERAKDPFARYVDLVEIENHNYCNRTCWFCPNVSIDRRSANHLMSDALFEQIISDLESIGDTETLVGSPLPRADG